MRLACKFVFNLLVFCAALAAMFWGIGRFLPPVQVPIVTAKVNWLAQHADDYDTLLIGSSRTFRQILPEDFEKEMAAAGQPVRVFNAGIDGMRPPEDTYLLEKLLAMRKTPIRLVIVECNPIRFVQREEDRDTVRAVYWHDWPRLMTMYRRAFLAETKKRNWRDRLGRSWLMWPAFSDHAMYWLWNASNLGRGHEMLFARIGLETPKPPNAADLGKRLDGYKPAADIELMSAKKTDDYETKLAAARAKPDRSDKSDPASLEELRIKRRLVEKAGGKMILVVPPVIGEGNLRLKESDHVPPVLDFSDPDEYPELFLARNRADTGHTNTAGSRVYTHLIVSKILPLLQAAAPAP